MKGGKTPLGYTIIEIMIVLAVSGLMFVIAANFINGKQEKAAFTQGVNEMASRVQGTIEQITDGQYSDIPLNCQFAGTTVFAGPTAHQGQNSNCVFLGKVLHLSEGGTSYKYETFSIAGGRVDGSGNPITSLTAADPKVIPGLETQQSTPQQLIVNNVTIDDSGTRSFAFGFFQGQGSPDIAHSLQDGPQSLSLYYVAGVTDSMNTSTSLATIQINGGANLVAARQVDICMYDGTQYADIILGTNNNQVNVTVKRYGTVRPATICV
jgi:prepilin-type N-terminal cleavage/methylation domain-containing protein